MNTESLIQELAGEAAGPVVPIGQTLLRALSLGAFLAALSLLILHPRTDIARALFTVPFIFKLALMVSLAGTSAFFLVETARPVPARRRRRFLLLAPLLLAGAVIIELATAPLDAWPRRLMGHNAAHCLTLIPLLSMLPLACLLNALRRGAPRNPVLAGATAGLAAGAVAALVYGLTCPDDSPLFILTWYSIAIAIVTVVSAYAGSRLLRW
jgi:hypothetical protein